MYHHERIAIFFERLMKRLQERGCPEDLLDLFWSQSSQIRAIANNAHLGGHTPFLPVIDGVTLSIQLQMGMVRNGTQNGSTNIDPNEYEHIAAAPAHTYWIFDVEAGDEFVGKDLRSAENWATRMRRSFLSVPETIALAVHADNALEWHHLYAAGTRHVQRSGSPILQLVAGIPTLDRKPTTNLPHDGFGMASCGRRISFSSSQ